MYDSYDAIPAELRAYKQWIVWQYEHRDDSYKPTKVPYSPLTGHRVSHSEEGRDSWATFDQAVECARTHKESGVAGIGFVFTATDPFAGVDLDDPYEQNEDGSPKYSNPAEVEAIERKIYDMFDSYSERSPSGKGLHIICKGHTNNGRRRGGVELYTSERFFTMTGDVYRDAPIQERQALVSTLWHELGGKVQTYTYEGDLVEKSSDDEIIAKASGAVNGEKFLRLHEGDITGYPSQSEADQAYMNFLAFYTQNRMQLRRMFLTSALGQTINRKRKPDAYIGSPRYGMIDKAFDQMLPPIDMDGFRNQLEDAIAEASPAPTPVGIDLSAQIARATGVQNAQIIQNVQTVPQAPPAPAPIPAPQMPAKLDPIQLPPGLLGELADFIYRSAPRPVPEIALAGAIGLMSGICGRSYNISATGLNMYVLLLAPTGTGKEAMASGIDKFMGYVMRGGQGADEGINTMPAVREFTGPAEISSGQALLKFIQKQRSFVSVVGEFGLTMQRLSHPRASSSDIMLKKVLLDLFNKSGQGKVLKPTIYSDKDKNTEDVLAPSFTLLGESTQESYYNNLDESLISDGLLPRFLTVSYDGKRPPLNRQHASEVPYQDTIDKFGDLCDNSLKLNAHNHVITVKATDEAQAFLDDVDTYVDDQINAPDQRDAFRHLWNRAHIKTLKLAALVAVGCDPSEPVITLDQAKWAYDVIERDVRSITRKFDMGEVGTNTQESKQVSDIIAAMRLYVTSDYETASKYGAKRDMHHAKVIGYTYLQRKLVAMASFRHDRVGATNAIKRTLQTMLDEGVIVEVGRADLVRYNARGKAYMISDTSRFV